MADRKLTRTERLARDKVFRLLWQGREDDFVAAAVRDRVPEAWHILESDLEVEEGKEKVTLYLDRSVARFYRAMGPGYQARVNRILATWAQLRIARLLETDRYLAEQRRRGVGLRAERKRPPPDEGDGR